MSNPTSNPAPEISQLDPVAVFSALGSKVRLPVIKVLADGRIMSVPQIAAMFGRNRDGISRQMRVLDAAGVVKQYLGEDRRLAVYQIPAAFRPSPGVLDFGFCRVDVNEL